LKGTYVRDGEGLRAGGEIGSRIKKRRNEYVPHRKFPFMDRDFISRIPFKKKISLKLGILIDSRQFQN
jgi:hypothetical protein